MEDRATFVVGTGRCGSTMISNMLREHPYILSLSEVFSLVTDGSRLQEPFGREPIDGARFWSIVSARTPFITFQLQHRGPRAAEVLYRYEDPATRYSPRSGVPALLLIALPHLTADHEDLFDELAARVGAWPPASIAAHYRRLFGALAARFGKRFWIERSGASLGRIPHLLELFPEARFIHIVRDGRDVALSMRADIGFRIAHVLGAVGQHLGVDPIASADRSALHRVPQDLRRFVPETFDDAAVQCYSVPLPQCGAAWSRQIVAGLDALGAVPAERRLTLRYEDFLDEPQRPLAALVAFLGDDLAEEAWSRRCAAAVIAPRSSWRALPAGEVRPLTAACRPAFDRLREAGVHYDG